MPGAHPVVDTGERHHLKAARSGLKLAIEMSGDTEVYVLDEPTSGLHMHDVDNLIGLLDQLVESGRMVIVIEHNLDAVARADWVGTSWGCGA